VAVASAGLYANLHLAKTHNHASNPPLSLYRPDALPATQPTASDTEGTYKIKETPAIKYYKMWQKLGASLA